MMLPLATTAQTVLDEFVVTATQDDTLRAFDAPVPVNLITNEEMKRQNIFSLPELFQNEPGMDAVTAGPGSLHPVIRGHGQGRVLVLVDGVRLEEERPGGNHVFSIAPSQIERVEVVRGPGSVLYGSGAIGGVINIITKKAPYSSNDDFRASGEVITQYESASDGIAGSAHGYTGQGSYNVYAGASYRDSNDIDTPEGELRFSHYQGYTGWIGGNYIWDNASAEIRYWQIEADIGIPAPATFVRDEFEGELHRMLSADLRYEPAPDWFEEAALLLSWQEHNRNRIRKPNALGIVNIQVEKDAWSLRPQLTLTPTENHRITTGLEFWLEDLTSSRFIANLPPAATFSGVPVMAPSQREGLGLFAQDDYSVSEQLNLIVGIRYDRIETNTDGSPAPYFITSSQSDTDEAFSGSIGAVYSLTENINLFANAGRAFRAPTLIERYFFGPHDGPGQDRGAPNLDPEISWNWDAGIRKETELWSASASLFYSQVDDLIQKKLTNPGAPPASQIFQFQNIAEAQLYGFELEGSYQVHADVQLFGWVSWVEGNDQTNDQPLTDIPPLKVRYGALFEKEINGQQFFAELSALSAARQNREGAGESETAGYTVVDIRAGITINDDWQINAAIENVFDKTYANHLSSAWQSLGYRETQRNFQLSASYSF